MKKKIKTVFIEKKLEYPILFVLFIYMYTQL